MNDTLLKKSLTGTPEAAVKVSARLHQDIMRAVRLAGPAVEKSSMGSAIPALGAAVLAMFVGGVLFYLPGITPLMYSPAPAAVQSQTLHPAGSLVVFGDNLLGLLKTAPIPEEELRKELQHLKSDLEKFDLRS
ncbi:MAG TPA: hypothetical protein VIS57_01820 [Xanthomonadales bacterium]